ncbi:MAG TPA: Uma2 family endonuclease [Oscillatoriales cyanobacterium M59_W2019_021]|nr:MAG: Uma2 family endonuclease [Cyanobacteria bacterium J055]HIK32564.1 Uma2 family endonuclease [Oscillatoriales cyanobacterium M4454_W2019_049]HIK52205.1 Uma2 family endonuclease [Oscillatoriales cyanobacterium M59_W2019_021]
MPATVPIVKPISQIHLAPGSVMTIPDVSWQEFESILSELGERRSARISYSNRTLEIMVPLPEHELPKDLMSDIVKILLKRTDRRYQPFGSTTFKKEGSAGVEPDACFYIQNYQRVIGCHRLKPDDPPPDLAIEIDVTSKTTLEAYEAIGVPELWIYDRPTLKIYILEDGKYRKCQRSPTFSELDLVQMIPKIVDRSWKVGSYQALEEWERSFS